MSNAAVWYISAAGQSMGPMTLEQVRGLLQSGQVNASAFGSGPGFPSWTPIEQIPALAALLGPAGAAAAPAHGAPGAAVPGAGGAPGEADPLRFELHGAEMQFVEVLLDPGRAVMAEAGAFMYMEPGIELETRFGDAGSEKKGLMGKLLDAGKRVIAGESLFMTYFTNQDAAPRKVAFAAPYPGKIIPVNLAEHGGEILCQKDAFLCAARGTSVGIAFQKKIGAGLFGGEGFILQRLTGQGLAFIHAGGTILQRDLAPGETLRIDTGCIVGFSPQVQYDIQYVGKIKTALFGGEGLFYAVLTGPGRVWLQSLPFSRLADRIFWAMPQTPGGGQGEGSILGGFGMGD